MKKLIFFTLFFFLVAVSFAAGQVHAQERKAQLRENMCTRVRERIADRREQFQEHRENRANIYKGVISRLNNLAAKLEDRDCDASKVTADTAQFETLVGEFVTSFKLFLDKLHAVGVPVCQEQPGDWKTAMAQARTQLQAAKTKHRAVRDFYKNTLKPDVKAAGAACK